MIKNTPLIILDFETGGFDAKINAVTEIAAIAIDSGTLQEIDRFEAVLKPYSDDLLYDPQALTSTGITMDMLNAGISFKDFTSQFISFLKKVNIHSHPKYRAVITGHNIQFDIKFLQQLFFYMNKKTQDYFNCSEDFYGNFYPNFIDTLNLSRLTWALDESMIDHKLGTCVIKACFELVTAHRAMNDVKSNLSLAQYFINNLRNKQIVKETQEISKFRDTFKF